MKLRYIIISLFLLTTGCIDLFFATPVDLSNPHVYWIKTRSLYSSSATHPEIAAAFGNTGHLFFAYISLATNIRVLRYNPADDDLGFVESSLSVPAKYISLVVAPAAYPDYGIPYVAAMSNSLEIALFSWNDGALTNCTIPSSAGYSNTALTISDSGTICLAASSGSSITIWTNYDSNQFVSSPSLTGLTPASVTLLQSEDVLYPFFHYPNTSGGVFYYKLYDLNSGTAVDSSANSSSKASAAFSTFDNSIHAAYVDNGSLSVRKGSSADLIDNQSWTNDSSAALPVNISDLKMVQYNTSGSLYLVYSTTSSTVGVLKYNFNDGEWQKHIPESASPKISGTFTAAVDPDDRLWLICTVQNANNPGIYNIMAYRSN